MGDPALYPLRFDPIFQYRLWGGRRLAALLAGPLPEGPIGEAWILSDREDQPSRVADGPLRGMTLGALLARWPAAMLGDSAGPHPRFPVLLKFLDAREMLSVQVHPSDLQTDHLPAGEPGKTEAWVVLEVGPDSLIYAGLRPGVGEQELRRAIAEGRVGDELASFRPVPGDGVFIPAGTVHTLGDVVVFEVQENSDVTFRLYDWDRVDARTGRPRALQIEEAFACLDPAQGPIVPVRPVVESVTPVRRERLFSCPHFGVWRLRGDAPFSIGAPGAPRVMVCLAGVGGVDHGGVRHPFAPGQVLLLPAVVGACMVHPRGAVELLELSLPERR